MYLIVVYRKIEAKSAENPQKLVPKQEYQAG